MVYELKGFILYSIVVILYCSEMNLQNDNILTISLQFDIIMIHIFIVKPSKVFSYICCNYELIIMYTTQSNINLNSLPVHRLSTSLFRQPLEFVTSDYIFLSGFIELHEFHV